MWLMQVRFVWALPAVVVNIAGMTEVAGEVCRGPGLAMYPLRTCIAATLASQVLDLACSDSAAAPSSRSTATGSLEDSYLR